MDYKKKYEEAERLYQTANADQRYVLERLFPELKESEDERIRKALIELVHDTTGDSLWVDYNVHKEDALAWLEKQGEQKPQRMISAEAKEAIYGKPAYAWSEEDEEHIHSLLDRLEGMCKKDATFTATRFAVNQDIDWLKSIKQKIVG